MSDDKKARTLYLTNIPYNASEKDISDLYSKYGEIEKITLVFYTEKNAYYSFVKFTEQEFADNAYSDRHNIYIGDSKIFINRSK